MTITTFIVLLLLLLIVVSLSWPFYIAWPLFGVLIVFCSIFGTVSLLAANLIWVAWFAAGIYFAIPSLRKKWVVKPLITKLRYSFPQISRTEQEALDAGDVWWEGQLFSGRPNWNTLFSYAEPKLTEEEQFFLDNQVVALCDMLNNWQVLTEKDLPKVAWEYLAQEKFFGLVIPKEYGGLGFSPYAHSTIVMKIATQSVTAAVTAMVPNSLGPGELLLKYGTDEQKNYYLPRLASAEEIPCFGLTSLEAGSDASNMLDNGMVCYGEHDGKEVLGIKLNWDKRYITLAPVATVLGLAFKLFDPNHILGDDEELGITVCLIPTDHEGVESGRRHWPMLLAFMNGPIRGKDVFIPMDWIIGGQDMIGQGWRMLIECLSEGRGISLPSVSTACAKVTYRMTGAYAKIRQQFKLPISQFEGVRTGLADIGAKSYMMVAMRKFVAGAVQDGLRPAIASAIAKYHMTEMARDIVQTSMDIHGGKALQTGPSNYIFPSYLNVPMGITVEGANILTRSLIIFGQGAVRCHPYLLQEMKILENADADQVDKFDEVLMRHIGSTLSNVSRVILYGLSCGLLIRTKAPKPVRKYVKQITRMSTALAVLSDMTFLVLGGRIKRKENLSARLGDVMSYTFMASSVLKFYSDHNFDKSHKDYVEWSVRYCLWKTQDAIIQFLDNFPVRWLAWLLKGLIMPLGRTYHRPYDKDNEKIVRPMLELSEIRENITKNCYVDKGNNNPKAVVEEVFEMSLKLSPLIKQWSRLRAKSLVPAFGDLKDRVAQAVEDGHLSEEEGGWLCQYYRMREQVLAVDEFDFELNEVLFP